MFDIAPTELMLVAVVALLVIGPKDLPKAMRFVGQWVGKARAVTRQFRAGFDTMVREAELAEMEKKWAEENARIMREFPTVEALPAPHRPEAELDAQPPVDNPYANAEALQTPMPDIRDASPIASPTAGPDAADGADTPAGPAAQPAADDAQDRGRE